MNEPRISDNELFALVFSERAKKLIEEKLSDLEDKLQDSTTRKMIAQNIKILMLIRGIPGIKRLGEEVSIDRAYLSRLLSGKLPLTIKRFLAIAHGLSVDPVTLSSLDLSQIIKNVLEKK